MEDNKYFTEKQVSKYFQISERTLGNYRREGRFTASYVSKYICDNKTNWGIIENNS